MRSRSPLLPVLLLVTTLAALAALAGCGAGAGPARPAQPPSAVTGDWTLASGSGPGGPLVLVPGSPVTLSVKDGTVSGRSACNTYDGPVSASGTRFVPGGLGVTMMGCLARGVSALETAYLTALADVRAAHVDGDRLVLTGRGVTLTFTRDAPVRDLPLEGTTWRLDTAFTGDTASTTLGDGVLRLDAGTLTGRGGCRELRGGYALSGSTLTTTGLGFVDDATTDCTADAARQDEQVLALLRRPVTVKVTGSRLTLTAGTTGFGFSALLGA